MCTSHSSVTQRILGHRSITSFTTSREILVTRRDFCPELLYIFGNVLCDCHYILHVSIWLFALEEYKSRSLTRDLYTPRVVQGLRPSIFVPVQYEKCLKKAHRTWMILRSCAAVEWGGVLCWQTVREWGGGHSGQTVTEWEGVHCWQTAVECVTS